MIVHSINHIQLFATPSTAAHQAPLSLTFLFSALKEFREEEKHELPS